MTPTPTAEDWKNWRHRLEKQLGRMTTDSEWAMARKAIAIRLRADLEMGQFDVR